jgi:hypothetical protein
MVAAMLEEEHPDADSLARAIIVALDEKRMSDPMFILGTMFEGIPLLWGPFATANQAARAASKIPGPRNLPGRVMRMKRIEEVQ